MAETNFEKIIKLVGLISSIYLFLKVFIPIIQNLLAEGIAGLFVVIAMIWWLAKKD